MIGADGIHSTVRHALYPDEGEPCFAHQILWRAIGEAEPFLGGRTQAIAGHLHQRIVAYPMAREPGSNRLLTNWICQMSVPETRLSAGGLEPARPEGEGALGLWRLAVSLARHCRTLIEQTSEIFEFPLMDRDPLPCWSFGRVTLLGDAAHPMQPIGAQAGSQAIIDGRVLTAALLSCFDPAAGIAPLRSKSAGR